MIVAVIYDRNQYENEIIRQAFLNYSIRYGDEDCECHQFKEFTLLEDYLKTEPVVDFLCVETDEHGPENLMQLRHKYPAAGIAVIADTSLSPLAYLRPGISPDALLLRPLQEPGLDGILQELVDERLSRSRKNGTCLLIHTRSEDQRIPFIQIICIESREKKVFIHTNCQEFGYYETLDHLQKGLPDGFIKCHRSFIVNTAKILKIDYQNRLLEMIDGEHIPISRNYLKGIRKYLHE